ncbi:hypothetical protein O9992_04065 [Vibrio lentus]|nr:hypothetical protein [Vibrio lentus]
MITAIGITSKEKSKKQSHKLLATPRHHHPDHDKHHRSSVRSSQPSIIDFARPAPLRMAPTAPNATAAEWNEGMAFPSAVLPPRTVHHASNVKVCLSPPVVTTDDRRVLDWPTF